MLTPRTNTRGPKYVAAIAPTAAPNAVPTNRSHETVSAAPSDDCVITKVVIAAQYASGSRSKRATRTETIAAAAVRAECTRIGLVFRCGAFAHFITSRCANNGARDPSGAAFAVRPRSD